MGKELYSIKIIGWLEIILGILAIAISMVGVWGTIQNAIMGFLMFLMSVPFIAFLPMGIGLLKLKKWSRVLNIVWLALIGLIASGYCIGFLRSVVEKELAVPFGIVTLLCIMGIIFFNQSSLREQFK
jgi:hypothetical protein